MQIQVNSDNQLPVDAELAARVEAMVGARLERVADQITRVEVHLSDVDGPKNGGNDKRCVVEIRPAGMKPISATDLASTLEAAASSAASKVLSAYDRQIGKQTGRKGH